MPPTVNRSGLGNQGESNMSVQTSPSRPATKSIGAAFVDILLTLAILVVVILSFLIAPLVALAVAYLAYVVLRPRARKRSSAPVGLNGPAAGFGAGTST
jgi:hypothetical protein